MSSLWRHGTRERGVSDVIPADHWRDNGDGTAWVVVECSHPNSAPAAWDQDDKPCGTCRGSHRVKGPAQTAVDMDCPDCDGTGRHTFEVEVESWSGTHTYDGSRSIRTLRVHVVPGMVLPIVDSDDWVEGVDCIEANPYGEFWLHLASLPPLAARGITLPPAAKPGMWAVQLRIVTPENVDGPT